MSGTLPAGSYADLLRRPAVARTFTLALAGRLAFGVLPLTLLFTVQHATGSFTQAAFAMSLNGLASLSMPLKARIIDRHGQRLVVPSITATLVVVLAIGSVMAVADTARTTLWLALGLAIGLASPPLGPSMRAQWRALAPDDVTRAYSLDSVGEETVFLVGPVVAAGLLALAPAYAGLLVAALLVTIGAVGLACSPVATLTTPAGPRTSRGPLRHAPFLHLLAVMAVTGAVISTIYTGTAARALEVGHPSYAGLAEAGIAVGSVTGGVLWGRLQRDPDWRKAMAALMTMVGGSMALASALGPFWLFAGALVLAGCAIAPTFVVAYRASDRLVDATEITEASTWVTTVTNLGVSVGGAGAGLLVGPSGARAPGWAGASMALLLAVALMVASRSRSARPAS